MSIKTAGIYIFVFHLSTLCYAQNLCHQFYKNKDQALDFAISTLTENLEMARKSDKIPAITFSVFSGGRLLTKGQLGSGSKKIPNLKADKSLFRTASTSKLVTAIAVAQLIEKGILGFDTKLMDLKKAPLVRYIELNETPERLERWRKITIRHLLNHQAGISKDLPDSMIFSNTESLTDHSYPSHKDNYLGILSVEFLFEPGAAPNRLKYSNLNFNLLARVVESYNPYAQGFEKYVDTHIFQPIGMKDSHYTIPKNKRRYLVESYGSLLPDGSRTLAPKAFLPESYDGSIGLASTATDLGRLGNEVLKILNGRSHVLTNPTVIEELFSAQTPATSSLAWANGPVWQYLPKETNGTIWVGGAGTGPSERSILIASPEKGMVISVLLDTKDANREAYAKKIFEALVYQAEQVVTSKFAQRITTNSKLFLSLTTAPEALALKPYPNPAELTKYVGTYFADLVGAIKITQSEDGYLVINGQKISVEDEGKGKFRYFPIAGPAGIDVSSEPVIFNFGLDGRPSEFLNGHGRVFRRIEPSEE